MSFEWLAEWNPAEDRDALQIIDAVAEGRDPRLVEQRERVMAGGGVFTFFRGAAGVMAADLGRDREHTTGVEVDIVGDAHLGNFGMYGSPERVRVFDVNDFDEAARGPWEWDVVPAGGQRGRRSSATAAAKRSSRCATARAASRPTPQTAAALPQGPLVDRWYTMTRCDEPGCRDLAVDIEGVREDPLARRGCSQADPKRTQAETVAKLTERRRVQRGQTASRTPIDEDARRARSTRRSSDYRERSRPACSGCSRLPADARSRCGRRPGQPRRCATTCC